MKTASLLLILFFLPLQSLMAEDLRFQVQGLRSQKGEIHLYIFDSSAKSDFPKKWSNAICHRLKAIQSKSMALSCDLKIGTQYAVFAHHDENKNGTMDHNFFRFPLEGYGFSAKAKINFGPPDFEDAAFIFTTADEVQVIPITYFFDED